jgi:hypothetical protein
VPRRIEVPSADALFGGPGAPPRAQGERPAAISEAVRDEIDVRPLPARSRRAPRPSPPQRADEGALRRLEELEAALADLPLDRLIELREELETLLASGSVDADRLERVLELGRR